MEIVNEISYIIYILNYSVCVCVGLVYVSRVSVFVWELKMFNMDNDKNG